MFPSCPARRRALPSSGCLARVPVRFRGVGRSTATPKACTQHRRPDAECTYIDARSTLDTCRHPPSSSSLLSAPFLPVNAPLSPTFDIASLHYLEPHVLLSRTCLVTPFVLRRIQPRPLQLSLASLVPPLAKPGRVRRPILPLSTSSTRLPRIPAHRDVALPATRAASLEPRPWIPSHPRATCIHPVPSDVSPPFTPTPSSTSSSPPLHASIATPRPTPCRVESRVSRPSASSSPSASLSVPSATRTRLLPVWPASRRSAQDRSWSARCRSSTWQVCASPLLLRARAHAALCVRPNSRSPSPVCGV
ncbi:uncharacterized protein B0H18DRAFT_478589 [Fomitopsis serialis]|uniref:uncharacterized protein n=1 Tax=Fomitopsis serialis TaxID=139415 RepID=UPI00200863BA|nr:uncharacterized protein B0H18DRAFT_478589 [Neoantrodia serialis]KAH9923051.1 hypothetical protein B0H18DRAFT_478589 [Neoantrodia serialis]